MFALLIRGDAVARIGWAQYLLHITPLAVSALLIRQLALLTWRHPSQPITTLWRAMCLVYATFPVYTIAWLMAMMRLPLAFRPTPKSAGGRISLTWLLPQALSLALLVCAVAYALLLPGVQWAIIVPVLFALAQIGPLSIFLWQALRERAEAAAIRQPIWMVSPILARAEVPSERGDGVKSA